MEPSQNISVTICRGVSRCVQGVEHLPFPPRQIQPGTKIHVKQTTTQQQSFYRPLSGTTRVSRYQKKHSPTHHPDHHPVIISFFHLPRSTASYLFKLRAWQSFCTTSLHVLIFTDFTIIIASYFQLCILLFHIYRS